MTAPRLIPAGPMLDFIRVMWPQHTLYDKQLEIVDSVERNDETVCVAGNMLGKDFITGMIVLAFFLTRTPVRVVTTSADHSQLEAVLWGEIRRFIDEAAYPLRADKGGPLLYNHLNIRKVLNPGTPDARLCGLSYIQGRVAAKGEGMLGHHIAETGDGVPRTLFVADEASGVDDLSFERAPTWARRILIIGNPYQCTNHFFRAVEGGDVIDPDSVKV